MVSGHILSRKMGIGSLGHSKCSGTVSKQLGDMQERLDMQVGARSPSTSLPARAMGTLQFLSRSAICQSPQLKWKKCCKNQCIVPHWILTSGRTILFQART